MSLPRLLVFALGLMSLAAEANAEELPYYAYFPSNLGTSFQRLEHNVLGFTIHIPAKWTCTVHGEPPDAIGVLHREGADTSRLGPEYMVVEIGVVTQEDLNLNAAHKLVLASRRRERPTLTTDEQLTSLRLGDVNAGRFTCWFLTKSGLRVHEIVTLVPTSRGLYALTARAAGETFTKNQPTLVKVLDSFRLKSRAY